MSAVRDARRALARGDRDAALVDLWNALEPLRLRGDAAGLHRAAQLAAEIARTGDGSQAREAERLIEAVRLTLDPDARSAAEPSAPVVAEPSPQVTVLDDPSPAFEEADELEEADRLEVGEYDPDADVEGVEVEDAEQRPRLRGLVWALIVAAFVIFNIVSGLLRE
jgi:hypothetical protein